jgi:hypothetical protein
MIRNIITNLRNPESVVTDVEVDVFIQTAQNKLHNFFTEINQQNGTLVIDIYNSGDFRYDVEGINGELRYKIYDKLIQK